MRRVVQESVSFLYADQGDAWVHEHSPVEITRATEPASVGECHVQEYTCGSRAGVVLRFGTIVGDDPMTRFQLRAVQHGHAIGLGSPDGWAHVVHTDDLGPAVLAALHVPSGVYNVGAEPVRRVQMVRRLLRGRRPRQHRLHGAVPATDGRGPARAARPVAAGQLRPLHGAERLDAAARRTSTRRGSTDALPTDVMGEALR